MAWLPVARAEHTGLGVNRLLEPGALFEGALYRDLLASGELGLAPGMRFGVFRLVRELGAGGMGVVWLAERDDGEYRQHVAIKCIADHRSEQGADLFRRERQILSDLKHPNIARLLDGGRREDGLLWFAMELIEGVGIDRHARERGMDVDARLRLFKPVIDAVSFAHGRLVIHRDIKPGNVLVDSDGQAKLLDFGIAAFAGDGTAARAYSPGWASPEQLDGADVGTASDQFQLGLLLDAILSAEEPAPRQGAAGVDPGRWIALAEYRRRELIAVLERACARQPEQRYGSVAELAAEIERLLEHRPVAALGRRSGYLFATALRRRPGAFAASAAALLLLTALVSGFTWRLAQERDLSRSEAQRAEAIKDFLVGLFRDGDPTRASDPDLSARALIQAGVLRVEADRELPSAARHELMQLLADIQLRLGDAEHAGALIERLDPSALEPGMRAEFEGRLALLRGRPTDGVRHLAQALSADPSPERQLLLARAESDAGQGVQSAVRLRELLLAEASLPDAFAASAWTSLGVLNWRDAKPLEALSAYDRSLARAPETMSPVAARINKGLALNDLGRLDEALAEYALAESALARFPNLKHQGLILQNRGMALLRKGDTEAAQTAWESMLGLVDDGANPGLEASAVHNLAATADRLGDPAASVAYSLRAEALRTQLGDAPAALSSRINVITKLYTFGLAETGVRMGDDAIARAQAMARPDLASRAQLARANNHCVLQPGACVATLEAIAAAFLAQDNQVKYLEVLEKIAAHAFERDDRQALERSVGAFLNASSDKPDEDMQSRIDWLQALRSDDPAVLQKLAADSDVARRALAHRALERNDLATARAELEKLPEKASDPYWALRERLALAEKDAADLAVVREQRTALRAQMEALLKDLAR